MLKKGSGTDPTTLTNARKLWQYTRVHIFVCIFVLYTHKYACVLFMCAYLYINKLELLLSFVFSLFSSFSKVANVLLVKKKYLSEHYRWISLWFRKTFKIKGSLVPTSKKLIDQGLLGLCSEIRLQHWCQGHTPHGSSQPMVAWQG